MLGAGDVQERQSPRVTEFIRVWAWEVPAYEKRGWTHDSAKPCPSTSIFGPSHIDVLLVRVPERGTTVPQKRTILPRPWTDTLQRMMAEEPEWGAEMREVLQRYAATRSSRIGGSRLVL